MYAFRVFTDGQPLGWCLAFALAATCAGALVLLLLTFWRRTGFKVAIWTLGAAVVALALAFVRITRSRSELVDLLLDQYSEFVDPSDRARLVGQALGRIFITVHFASPFLAFAMLALLLAAVRSPARTMERRLAMLATSLALLCAVLLYWANAGALRWSCPEAEDLLHCRFRLATENLRSFHVGAWCLLGAGALAWAVLARAGFRDARRGLVAGSRTLLCCSALLLAGVGAFWATRAQASDAAHLVPAGPANVHECPLIAGLQAQLPPADAACVAMDAPLVQVRDGRLFIDGTAMSSPAEAQQVLADKRKLWQLLNPGRAFAGALLFGAPQGAKTKELLPWLLACQAAGYDKLAVLLRVAPVTVQTRTVGRLEKKRCCADVWSVDPLVISAFARAETWGELVAANRPSAPAVLPE